MEPAASRAFHTKVGREDAGAARRMIVISPHLDDAVFACGERLATVGDATVVTVFAGRPPPGAPVTPWDADAGFALGDDVIGVRRDEDRCALARVGARPVWLDFRDDQYGCDATIDAIAEALVQQVSTLGAGDVLFPLGLFHADHWRAHAAALALIPRLQECRFIVYEDALYRRIDGLRDAALDQLQRMGYELHSLTFDSCRDAHERKRAAVSCYRSQLRALEARGRSGYADVFAREGYRAIVPAVSMR